ncbi:MAG: hypothetical protein ACO3LT_06590 [Ilumatobacteraceae bacterium]
MKTIILRQRHVVEIDGHRVMKEAGDLVDMEDATAAGFVDSGWAAWPSATAPETRAEDPAPQNRDEEITKPKRRGRPRKTESESES